MIVAFFIIPTLISWCECNVLPLFYPPHPNTIPLTSYIQHFYKPSTESRRNHKIKHVGTPENKGPPHIYRGCRRS